MTESSLIQPAAVPSSTEPARPPRGYVPTFAAANFGIMLALMTPALVTLAFKVQHITTTSAQATSALGLVTGVGAVFALITNPLAGRLSDRTTSRWGMRRPWLVGGVLTGLLAFMVIGVATSVWLVLIAWCVAQAAMNAVLAAANATVPDQVPTARRGMVSGIVGLAGPVGMLVGTAVANVLPGDFARFTVPAVVAVALVLVFARALPDRVLTERPTTAFTVKEFLGSFVFNPVKHPDFGWTWLTKFLVMFGYAGVATFLPFYLTEQFGLGEQDAIQAVLLANVAFMGALAVSGPLGGILSDKVGKRRPFVAVAGLIMVVGLVVLAFAPSVTAVVVGQAIVGLGVGSFMSVDLALATQVLPNPDDAAKDLGVLNMANALPQSLAPSIAPVIIAFGATTALGGYATFYLFGALVALAGAILVYRIKGVK
ncbi:MFS transporter [Cellulomonas sp. Marseille-Q8402]